MFGLLCPAFIVYPESLGRMPMPRSAEPAMTVRDVATFLNVDEKTIYRLTNRGDLPGFKVAGAWRFQHADLQRWVDERKRRSVLKEQAKKGSKR